MKNILLKVFFEKYRVRGGRREREREWGGVLSSYRKQYLYVVHLTDLTYHCHILYFVLQVKSWRICLCSVLVCVRLIRLIQNIRNITKVHMMKGNTDISVSSRNECGIVVLLHVVLIYVMFYFFSNCREENETKQQTTIIIDNILRRNHHNNIFWGNRHILWSKSYICSDLLLA